MTDARRRRRNFDLHARLRPALLEWYTALDVVLPGRVQFRLSASLVAQTGQPLRAYIKIKRIIGYQRVASFGKIW